MQTHTHTHTHIYIYILTLCAFQKMSCIYVKLKDIHKIVIFRDPRDKQSAQISQKQDGRNIYVYIYVVVLWQPMHLGT